MNDPATTPPARAVVESLVLAAITSPASRVDAATTTIAETRPNRLEPAAEPMRSDCHPKASIPTTSTTRVATVP